MKNVYILAVSYIYDRYLLDILQSFVAQEVL